MKKTVHSDSSYEKERRLMDAVTNVPDDLISEAEYPDFGKKNGRGKNAASILRPAGKWRRITAAACAVLFLGAGIFLAVRTALPPLSGSSSAAPLVQVSMPDTYEFSDFDTERRIREANPVSEDFTEAIRNFSYETASSLLSRSRDNLNYSPLSLYYALALTASGAGGETQEELLSLLGMDNAEDLSLQCGNLYRLLYLENEIGSQKIASSLWMDDSIRLKQGFLENAARNFYAESFSMDLQAQETAEAMAHWIAGQTEGTLTPSFTPDSQSVLSILNTVYFHDEWVTRFSESRTEPDSFYLADGSSVSCDFMNQTFGSASFSVGNGFTRASLGLKNGGRMIFILPDETISPQELAATPERLQEAFEGGEDYSGEVVWQIPKFRFSSAMNLNEMLQAAGIDSAFGGDADFSEITDYDIWISGITQETCIGIDEKGVEASAFTKIDYAGAAMPEGRAEMILNRPFLYGIVSSEGSLLFAGIFETPA